MKKLAFIGTTVVLAGIAGFSFRSKPEHKMPEISVTDGKVKELPVVKNEAFNRGEVLSFKMHYGMIDAGVATLAVTDEAKEIGGRKTFHIVGIGTSKGAFDFFFKVRDRYETYIDEKAIVPWLFQRRVYEGGYTINQDYIFNHFAQKVNVGEGKVYDIEPNMQDMLSAFYNARTMDLSHAKPGDIFTLSCFMDKEIYPLKIKFIGREDVTIKLGTFKCLKFRPIVQKGRVFKHEEDLNVWLTDDKNHIPVKGQADVLVGSIKLELTNYSGLMNPIAKVN
ncbi:MAG: DUF3108 domain-containing protein [Bacteroidota bacterium]|nr:DUF3108 domain-containing protein [Bacteroidota bacterium]